MIERDVLSGRTDPETFNWQMAELLMRLEPMHYKDTISQVLRAFCVRNKNIGYCQGLNYIAV